MIRAPERPWARGPVTGPRERLTQRAHDHGTLVANLSPHGQQVGSSCLIGTGVDEDTTHDFPTNNLSANNFPTNAIWAYVPAYQHRTHEESNFFKSNS